MRSEGGSKTVLDREAILCCAASLCFLSISCLVVAEEYVVLPPYVSYPFHAWSWRRNITVPGIRVAPFKRFLLPVQLFLLNVLCVRV